MHPIPPHLQGLLFLLCLLGHSAHLPDPLKKRDSELEIHHDSKQTSCPAFKSPLSTPPTLIINGRTKTFYVIGRSNMNTGENDRYLSHFDLSQMLGRSLDSSKKLWARPANQSLTCVSHRRKLFCVTALSTTTTKELEVASLSPSLFDSTRRLRPGPAWAVYYLTDKYSRSRRQSTLISLTMMIVHEGRVTNGFLAFGLARREDTSKLRAVELKQYWLMPTQYKYS